MENLKFYTLRSKEGLCHPYFITSTDDKDACKLLVDMLTKSVNQIQNPQEKLNMLEQLRECEFVKVGYCDLTTAKLTEDYNVLLDLRDFMIEVKKDDK